MRRIALPLSIACAMQLATACARPAHDASLSEGTASGALAADASDAATRESFSIFELGSSWKDQNGRNVTLEEVSGKATVVALIYTNCTHTCPLIIGALKRVESAVREHHQDVRFLLVSIDPDRDTPRRLAEWAAATRLDDSRWTVLVGSDAAIRELAVTLDVRYQKQTDGEIAHTNGFSIIDREGHVTHVQTGYSDVDQAVATIRAQLR